MRTSRKFRRRRGRPSLECVLHGHSWGELEPTIVATDLDLPPEERRYELLGLYRVCGRCDCFEIEEHADPDVIAEAIAETRREDIEEWNDPAARAEYLEALAHAQVVADGLGR